MRPHLLIFGFGYTAHFLAKKAREINIQATATTRNDNALGYDDEYAASLLLLPSLKRLAYEMATLSLMAQEFYSHNKRVSNTKLKRELNMQLTYSTYKEGLAHLLHNEGYLCQ